MGLSGPIIFPIRRCLGWHFLLTRGVHVLFTFHALRFTFHAHVEFLLRHLVPRFAGADFAPFCSSTRVCSLFGTVTLHNASIHVPVALCNEMLKFYTINVLSCLPCFLAVSFGVCSDFLAGLLPGQTQIRMLHVLVHVGSSKNTLLHKAGSRAHVQSHFRDETCSSYSTVACTESMRKTLRWTSAA